MIGHDGHLAGAEAVPVDILFYPHSKKLKQDDLTPLPAIWISVRLFNGYHKVVVSSMEISVLHFAVDSLAKSVNGHHWAAGTSDDTGGSDRCTDLRYFCYRTLVLESCR